MTHRRSTPPSRQTSLAVRHRPSASKPSIAARSNGEVAFDDTVGEVSGTWVTGRLAASEPGLVVYVMVESVAETLDTIREAGGEVVTPLTPQGEGEAFATFRDPAGNVLGIGQQP